MVGIRDGTSGGFGLVQDSGQNTTRQRLVCSMIGWLQVSRVEL